MRVDATSVAVIAGFASRLSSAPGAQQEAAARRVGGGPNDGNSCPAKSTGLYEGRLRDVGPAIKH
jgi:hypothetical protein